MTKDQQQLLNITQQVLRSALIAIAAASKANLSEASTLMAASAKHPQIDPIAREMLQDLSVGFGMLGGAVPPTS